ncbi:insulinase family protein, partial [Alistipes sp. OttesenSCG-928-B03]|nr:insulinase family protein [Alistipes sp. OttesenSCG-928-B03]
WYRPDMQAIVIVGDIDVDQIEQKIKATMADIPAVENPEAKVPMPIAGNEEPMIRVDSDPELTGTALSFIIKHEAFPTELNDALPIYALRMMINAANSMLNTRLSEMAQETNSPFLGSQVGYSGLSAYNDAFVGSVSARNGELGRAFEAFYTELEKARRYGFSESELERVKTNSLVAAQRAFEARGDRRSGDFVQTYINNFSKNSPMPSAETSWELSQMLIPSLDVKQINELFKQITPYNNTVILAQGPDIKQLPTEEELAAIIEKVKAADIEAYEDTTIDEPLMTRKIKAGKVKKSEKGMYGSTIWTLSNGVKVILKPTDFRVDQISMSGRAKGGLSTISDDDYISGSLINNVVGASGLGKFSNIEMGKLLTGKVASSGASIGGYSTSVSGSSSKKDIETMLQLVNMRFIEPRWNREDFDRLMDRLEVALKNQEGTPDFKLQQEVTKTLYGTGVRVSPLTLADMDKVSFEKMAPIYAKMFANASDFTFTFVGDFDMETLKPLVEKYLGSLPAKGPKMKDKDDGTRMVRGQVENRFKTEMQAPKSTVLYVYSGDIEYNLENNMTMTFLKDALSNRYHESIREEKGGTYGVGVSASLGRNPIETYSMQVSFETDPKMVDELVVLVEEELQKIAENGPLADDLAKTKEFLVKNRPEQLKSNGTWAGYLMTYYTENDDFYTDYDRLLNEMDGKKVQALAQKILRDGNLAKIIMDPEQ